MFVQFKYSFSISFKNLMLKKVLSAKMSLSSKAYEVWLQQEIQAAIDDVRPGIPHEEAMEKVSQYVKAKIQHHLAKTGAC